MKSNTIHQIASLVMALAMILGNTIHTQALPIVEAAGPSIYWGALVDADVPSSTNLQGSFNTFETHSGKKMSIIHWGQPWMMNNGSWGEFQTSYFDNVRNHGSIPMLNWGSHRLGYGATQSNFQLRDIYNGTYDAYIKRWATDAKNWGHPFFLRFDHEMNAWWYAWGEGKTSAGGVVNGNSAGDYVKAWRHVHDIFKSVGATNVTWVWAPNQIANSKQYTDLSTLYPGDAYVDWTGLDVYNKYNTWAGLNPLMTGSNGLTWVKDSYHLVLSVAPNKPMMLAEVASIEAGDGGAKKAAWITDALTKQIPINFPKIKAVVWFNWQETPDESYLIESSSAAMKAWAAGIGSSIYASNQYANLNTSPIPSLTSTASSYSISGNVGAGGTTLKYTNGSSQSVKADINGNYSISVPRGWSGTVTPSHLCYGFNATSRSYTNITVNQTGQNYSATFNGSSCGASAGKYDDGDAHWVYAGAWHNFTGSGPLNGTLHYAVTAGDWAWFPFNGTQFILSYTQYPNRGSFEVSVDGQKITTINANGTAQWQRTYTSPVFSAGAHFAQFRNIGGSGTVIDVDAIQILNGTTTVNASGAGKYDGNDAHWSYSGAWQNYSGSGPYNNTLRYSVTVGNTASFTFSGTQFILSYTKYPNRGSFEVVVDGQKITTINANGTAQWQKTYSSATFSAGTHVLRLKNIGGSGSVMDVDAIQILNGTTAVTAPGAGKYDGNDAHWSYSSGWQNYSGSGPYNNTLHYTTTVGNTASFTFSGTQFVFSYTKYPNRGSFEVYMDGKKITTINANGTVQWQKTYTSPAYSAGTHTVQIKNIGGSSSVIDVDAIEILP